jgi:hypothetical protein
MNISDKDMKELCNHFDADGDGTITYDEFIAKVLPPEFVHGGGGIMDFESDDPDFQGAVTKNEQLLALKKQIRRQLLSKGKLNIQKVEKCSKLCHYTIVVIIVIVTLMFRN